MISVQVIARGTPGFSGADLANLVNLAALRAARDGAPAVTQAALEHAKDRIMMGAERKVTNPYPPFFISSTLGYYFLSML